MQAQAQTKALKKHHFQNPNGEAENIVQYYIALRTEIFYSIKVFCFRLSRASYINALAYKEDFKAKKSKSATIV